MANLVSIKKISKGYLNACLEDTRPSPVPGSCDSTHMCSTFERAAFVVYAACEEVDEWL